MNDWRSLLFVPGDRAERMQRACESGADAVILDLEDSVAAERKAEARAHITALLRQGTRPVPLLVRVNPLHSPFIAADLAVIAGGRPDGIVLPKADGAAAIEDLAQRLQALGAVCPILPIATETPQAVFRLHEYASVAGHLLGLTWGAEDLSAAIGAESARDAQGHFTNPYQIVRSLALFAAHAAQIAAIDTVFPDLRDAEGLAAYARRAAADGFTGMLALHPQQVAVIHQAFMPSTAGIERARRIVAAFAEHPGAGVLKVDGEMVDAPHLRQAQRVLARSGGTGK